jgi:hypothetical protein
MVRLYLTQFLSSDIIFIARVKGCIMCGCLRFANHCKHYCIEVDCNCFMIIKESKILGKCNLSCLHVRSRSG